MKLVFSRMTMIVKPMLTPPDARDLLEPTKFRLGAISVTEVTLTSSASTPRVSAVMFWKALIIPSSTSEAFTPKSSVVAVN